MHFLLVPHQSDQPFLRFSQNIVFDLEKTHPKFFKKICQNNCFQHKFLQNLNRVITMTCTTKLPCFVVIWWVVLTLSRRQANFCLSTPQLWAWVKVMERSSSTFSADLHILCAKYQRFGSNVFTWDGKNFCGGWCGGRGGNELKT